MLIYWVRVYVYLSVRKSFFVRVFSDEGRLGITWAWAIQELCNVGMRCAAAMWRSARLFFLHVAWKQNQFR